ncbi:MAG: transposase [Candidatus Bathyarchaeota archaeon]|uniref:transposase n=1 Tax=Candidatus Bathycorpusculum sp. TaxID=2994959 RepID=UPI002825CCF3|nr:transposase [Candidatus Termiticorpusculum sp.]MCL2257084.1 transposase [Candidatus Termiticorpusculum sp.]MCL2292771.1 transposase [Candidatus Termiticorpusculum sp.]
MSESPYKDAPKVRLVLDNLNTHVVASLYKVFLAVKARGLVRRLEFHYTPVYGSWFNVAEISISVLFKQCIGRCMPDLVLLNCEIGVWVKWYNSQCRVVKWQFTTDDARIKLHKLYPVF